MLPLKKIRSALLSAVVLSSLALAPVSAQGAYPGSYGTGGGTMSYGMPGPMVQPAYPPAGQGRSAAGSPMMGSGAGGATGMRMGSSAGTRYVVRFGDTLDGIAARFGTTPLTIVLANPRIVNASRIFVGERLLIPAGMNAGFFGDGDFDADDRAALYQVIFGDTLSRIAVLFRVKQAVILQANPAIVNPNLIFAGQRLLIPLIAKAPATPTPTPSPQTITVPLTAQNFAFSTALITVPHGAHVMVNFNNQDNLVPHTFSVYTNSSATTAIFVGPPLTGVGSTTYTFTAPGQAGTYFFRCDVHPTLMNGQFVVQ